MTVTYYSVWLICLLMASVAFGDSPRKESFGRTRDGLPVDLFTLKNDQGLVATVMTRGATLVELSVPDRIGKTTDVVLGFDSVAGYESDNNQYFGCTTGRVCNRIAKGRFTLDGREYPLAVNNAPNHLHGGATRSLDKVVWDAAPFSTGDGHGVRFSYSSPDGEEGYPGRLNVTVTYFVPMDSRRLDIRYEATTDQATPVNLTNHTYFNLSGAGSPSVLDHVLQVNAARYLPCDDTLIPTGEISPAADTSLDFRIPVRIGARIESLTRTSALGYDHNFVLDGSGDGKNQVVAAVLGDPQSGRVLTVWTTEPGIQVYSGNFLKGQTGKRGRTYPQRSAICLETQHFPDSVNQPTFPTTILKPGAKFHSETSYVFSVQEK